MIHLKVSEVVFALNAKNLVDAVNRSLAWPALRYISSEVRVALSSISFWSMKGENSSSNHPSSLIESSVTSQDRTQSYASSCYPFWLNGLFGYEKFFFVSNFISFIFL